MEVEMFQLFGKLSQATAALNDRSDEINRIIQRMEEKLRELSVGIEVWTTVESDEKDFETREEDREGNSILERRSVDVELGYGLYGGIWHLLVRHAVYRKNPNGGWALIDPGDETRLLDASRNVRIAAVAEFPALLTMLHKEAEAAVDAIDGAEKLVKL